MAKKIFDIKDVSAIEKLKVRVKKMDLKLIGAIVAIPVLFIALSSFSGDENPYKGDYKRNVSNTEEVVLGDKIFIIGDDFLKVGDKKKIKGTYEIVEDKNYKGVIFTENGKDKGMLIKETGEGTLEAKEGKRSVIKLVKID